MIGLDFGYLQIIDESGRKRKIDVLLGIVRYVKPFLTVWYELRVASMYIELFSLPLLATLP